MSKTNHFLVRETRREMAKLGRRLELQNNLRRIVNGKILPLSKDGINDYIKPVKIA